MSSGSKSYNAVVEIKGDVVSTTAVTQSVTSKKEGIARLKALKNESREVKRSLTELPARNEPKRYKSRTYPESGKVMIINSDNQESMECPATKHTLMKDLIKPALEEWNLSFGDVDVKRFVTVDMEAKLFDINPYQTTITVSAKKPHEAAESESSSSDSD